MQLIMYFLYCVYTFGNILGHICQDRKSTRLNSSHDQISYAVFCLKKKKNVVLKRSHLQNLSTPYPPPYKQSPPHLGGPAACMPSYPSALILTSVVICVV